MTPREQLAAWDRAVAVYRLAQDAKDDYTTPSAELHALWTEYNGCYWSVDWPFNDAPHTVSCGC